MFQHYGSELLRAGIVAAKSGDRDLARHYLERAVYAIPNGEHEALAEAWFWLGEVLHSPAERRRALENALTHNFVHARARRALAILDGRLRPEEVVDPDRLPAIPKGLLTAETERMMCPRCGGRMAFRPDGQAIVCEYCARSQFMGDPRALPGGRDFVIAMATARGHRGLMQEQAVRCDGCGARLLVPTGQISLSCPYCGSPHVVHLTRTQDMLSPDGVVPHAFGPQQAAVHLREWLKQERIRSQGKVSLPRGLYLPMWTFEVGGTIGYVGERVEMEQAGRSGLQATTVRVQDHVPVIPQKVPIPASRKLSAPFTQLLATFDLTRAQAYDPRFLADWPAELYDIAMADASLDARAQAYQRQKSQVPGLLRGIRLLTTSSADLTIESFELLLLPVWLCELHYDGRMHAVLVNGDTGAVRGEATDRSRRPPGARGRLFA